MTAFWVSYTNLSVTGNSSHTAAAVCCLRKETAPSAQTEERLGILGKRKFKIGLQVLLLVINVLFWETGHLVQRKIHPDSPERTFQCALWQSLSYPCPSRNRISFPCSNRLLNSSNTNSSAAALQPVAVCKLCSFFDPAEQTHRPHPLLLKCFKETTFVWCKGRCLRGSNPS